MKSVAASMAPVAAMAPTPMSSCNAWSCRNEKECKCEEGCYSCPAHTAYSVEETRPLTNCLSIGVGRTAQRRRGNHAGHQPTHHGLGLRGDLPRRDSREYRTASPEETV